MKRLLAMLLALSAAFAMTACVGGEPDETTGSTDPSLSYIAYPGTEDGILSVGMECMYAPYNWTQTDDANGAVPIVNNPGTYANGYDVMIAKRICDSYGWELEIMAIEWGGLSQAVNNGTVDAVIAGQSMTDSRLAEVDMAGPYFYASIVCVAQKDSVQADATGISGLTGTCTAQACTVWYDECLPQIPGAQLMAETETTADMIAAVASGAVDFICTDMPTAMSACAAYGDLVILDFADSGDGFDVDESEINIGISVGKGNTGLRDAIDAVIGAMTEDDFTVLMDQAIDILPRN